MLHLSLELTKDDQLNFTISSIENSEVYEMVYSRSFSTKDISILTSREVEILKLLCEGKSTPKIANQLNLSEHTIKSHRKNIMQKMEVNNSIDIVRVAYGKGYL